MPATYAVTIEPVTENADEVLELLIEFTHSEERAKQLLDSGGTVAETSDEEEAKNIRKRLEQLGVDAELVVREHPPDENESEIFSASGTVLTEDGERVGGLIVRLVDRDLQSEQFLGETSTDEEGSFEIQYTPDQFTRAEKNRADLSFSVVTETGTPVEAEATKGVFIDGERVIFNAEPHESVDLVIASTARIELSEYEVLVANITRIANGKAFADLNPTEVEFCSHELNINPERIEAFVTSARLAREIDLPTEAIYGWIRLEGPEDRDELRKFDQDDFFEVDSDDLYEVIDEAIEGNIVPPSLEDELEAIVDRYKRLREEARITRRQTVTGRLTDVETGRPLARYPVDVVDVTPDGIDPTHEEQVTDEQGRFSVTFALPDGANTGRTIQITVRSPEGEVVEEREFDINLDSPEEFDIAITVPKPGNVDLAAPELREALEGVPDDPDRLETVLDYLKESVGVSTLADIRTAGGVSTIVTEVDEPPVAPDDPIVGLIDAHVELSLLSSDLSRNATLIEKNYRSPFDIAETPPDEFIAAVIDGETFGEVDALRLHYAAFAQKRVLDNILAGRLADRANNLAVGYEEVS